MPFIPIVDLQKQYFSLQAEIDAAVLACLREAQYVGGKQIQELEKALSNYIGMDYAIACGNGTDALQLCLMALELPARSKIIVPAFTYIATVEVIRLLGYEIVYADVDPDTFQCTPESIDAVFSPDVKAIIAVHLYGQTGNIAAISAFAKQKGIFLIEDNAQSFGSEKNIRRNSLITTSFYPSKNLGAYGDGGAVFTNDASMAQKIRKLANHGQTKKYTHELVGINSRLDTIQAAILQVKLKHLDQFIAARQQVASWYDDALNDIASLQLPVRSPFSSHTFYLYTIRVRSDNRDALQQYLFNQGITTVVHYPQPCYRQQAYLQENFSLMNTELLCKSVLSLPLYPEITKEEIQYICKHIRLFFENEAASKPM